MANYANSRRCNACNKRWPLEWAGKGDALSKSCPRCGRGTAMTFEKPDHDDYEAGVAYVERLCREADELRLELGFPLPEEVGREEGRREARRLRARLDRAKALGLAVTNADLDRLMKEDA